MSARSSAALSHADAAVGQKQQQLEALRRCRASRARAFRWIHMEWPKLHDEAVTFWMLWYARKDMRQAARDCEALDAQCVRLGLPPIYVAAAVAFDAPGALNSLYYRAWKEVCGHARGASPFGAAVQREDIETARDKQLLDDLREALRDGLSVEETLGQHREECAARIHLGRTDFAIALGKLLDEARRRPQKYLRSTTDWLERAWFPLRLWECAPDGEEAWSRLKEAITLLPIPEIAFHQFHTAWRNLRTRMKR
ncbi:MAG: hypothetical protein ACAH88_19520 [Roseimicrobium sp.]